ncbi:MAG: hypothetical protein V4603_13200, partial [Pseudomonadota bacterium]
GGTDTTGGTGTTTGTGGTGTTTGNGNGNGNGNSGSSGSGTTTGTTTGTNTGTGSTTGTTTTGNGNGSSGGGGGNGGGNGNGNGGQKLLDSNVAGYALSADSPMGDFGYWEVDVKTYLTALLDQLEASADLQSLNWPLTTAVEIADRTGTATYASTVIHSGADEQGAALQSVQMSFLLDLAGGNGAISNGQLVVLDASNQRWNIVFNGDVSGAKAVMHSINGTAGDAGLTDAAIQGIFLGSPGQPDFLGGFDLQSGSDSVHGVTILRQ